MAGGKEQEVLVREYEWLLEKEYELRVSTITTQLQDCLKKFSDAFNSTGDQTRPILINQNDVLCTASIEGDAIVKAEINIKLPGRGSKPVRTSIKEHYPWRLKQIQDSANYLKDASEKLEGIQQLSQQSSVKTPTEIRLAFEQLIASLRRAESVLVHPPSTTALQIYNSDQKTTLRPALPEDVMLHFHINSAMLVLSIFTMLQMSKNQSSGTRSVSPDFMSTNWVGSTFEQGSNTYEISNQVQVRSLVPWLSKVLVLLQGMLELAQDFTDKVKVFEAMGLELESKLK